MIGRPTRRARGHFSGRNAPVVGFAVVNILLSQLLLYDWWVLIDRLLVLEAVGSGYNRLRGMLWYLCEPYRQPYSPSLRGLVFKYFSFPFAVRYPSKS